jgi:hypothetical protein
MIHASFHGRGPPTKSCETKTVKRRRAMAQAGAATAGFVVMVGLLPRAIVEHGRPNMVRHRGFYWSGCKPRFEQRTFPAVKLYSNIDGEPAWIAVGMQPVGVVAIGIMPIGILAIACGAGRGVVVVSCGVGLGLVSFTCGLSAALYGIGVGLHIALAGRGMTLTAFGDGDPRFSLVRKLAIPPLILAAFLYYGWPLVSAARIAAADRQVAAQWSGVAKASEGIYVAPGTPCAVRGNFAGDGSAVLRAHVGVTCGHLTLFESGPIRSGSVMVMGSDDLQCEVTQSPANTGFSYGARCNASEYQGSVSRGTGAFGPRPSLQLDTPAGRAVLDLGGSRPMHVEIAVDARSAPVDGPGLFSR